MTNLNNITKFLQNGTQESFQYIYNCYADCLQMKCSTFQNQKNKQDLIKLDEWIHNDLPAKIAARKPEPHILHEELINIVKWKLLRTCVKNNNNKNLKNLIIMNSPRLVMTETKKAFKVLMKKDNIQMALSYLTNLKGITLTTATLIISLVKPYPYMSDECIESIPEIYSLNYSITNYMSLINYFKNISTRLNNKWTNRTLEHIIWIYQMLLVNKSYDLLLNIPQGSGGEGTEDHQIRDEEGENGTSQVNGAPTEELSSETHSDSPAEEAELLSADDGSSQDVPPSAVDQEKVEESDGNHHCKEISEDEEKPDHIILNNPQDSISPPPSPPPKRAKLTGGDENGEAKPEEEPEEASTVQDL